MFTTSSGRLRPAWAFVLSALLSAVAFYLVATLAQAIARDHYLISELIFRPLLAAVLLGLFSWLLTTADHVEEHRIAAQGLPHAKGWLRQFAGGCGLGFALVTLALVAMAIWGKGFTVDFHIGPRTVPRVLAVLVVLICGALAEELMFRGYPFQRLEEAIGPVGAIAVFSSLFGTVHLLNPGATPWGLLDTVLIGIVLAVAYLRTRALWLPWGIHFGWNVTLGLLFGLPVSGLRIFNVAVRTTIHGPRWLTGGSYGIEGSAAGATVVLIGLVVVCNWRLTPLRGLPDLPRKEDAIRPTGFRGIES